MGMDLLDFLKMNEVEYKENLCLKKYSSARIGGIAPIVIFPNTEQKMITALDFLLNNQINFRVLGGMTNVLINDEHIEYVVIKTDKMRGVDKSLDKIRLCAGERLSYLSQKLALDGIDVFYKLSGIPGSIGGMIKSNAGAFGMEISDIIESAVVYSLKERRKICLDAKDMDFGYRDSIFKYEPLIVLYADFRISRDNPEAIALRMADIRQCRMKSQPQNVPSLGSVFKRPIGDFAARLIDEAGLKGVSIGDAQVSKKHAGFIINKGNASFEDFKRLVEYVKHVVYEKYKVMLEEEIEII